MNRISPRLLGLALMILGLCAAIPFRRSPDPSGPAEARRANSESIQWRSNDFTLEVVTPAATRAGSPYDDQRSTSPAFGGTAGQAQASLDQIPTHQRPFTQPSPAPPALAEVYSAAEPGGDHPGVLGLPAAGTSVPSPQSVAITHRIADGDTLETLAEKHLGSRLRWTEIYNANPGILDDPEVLPLGVTIVILPGIPASASEAADPDELVPVSRDDLLKFGDAIN